MARKNSLIKILVVVLCAMLCAASIFALAACDQTKDIKVTFVYGNGQPDRTITVVDGRVGEPAAPTREDYTFLFWAQEGTDTAFDFSKTIAADIKLIAQWKAAEPPVIGDVNLYWQSDESAKFVFSGNKPNKVKEGTSVSFEVEVSPYYVGEPVVSAGTTTLTQNNGVYTFTAESDVTVTIGGLSMDTTPIAGSGTEKDPFVISTPAQFKKFTDSVNADNDATYNEAYVKLGADLDFKGVTIDPVGTGMPYYNMMFMGNFDGCGHTVSNFEVSDEYNVVGLFGYLFGARVANLNVKTNISARTASISTMVGGIAAYTFGSDVVGCSFDGSISIACGDESEEISTFVGGIVGFSQGMTDNDLNATSTISYCTFDGEILSNGIANVAAIGGIAGATEGRNASSGVNVFNCYADVNIGGSALRAGGIIGWQRKLSTADDCLSVGVISVMSASGTEAALGGVVGDAYNENVISRCVSSVAGVSGFSSDEGYGIVGILREDGYNDEVDAFKCLLLDNKYSASGIINDKSFTVIADIIDLTGWNANEWEQGENAVLPVYAALTPAQNTTFKFGAQLKLNDGTLVSEATLTDLYAGSFEDLTYLPLGWVFEGDGLNTLTAENGSISYGFFLDEEYTVRVPASYLLNSKPTTIYVAFADYSPIAGDYYAHIGASDVKLTFDDNGRMTMITDGMRAYYMYVFDGEKVVIHDAYFLYLGFDLSSAEGSFLADFIAEPTQSGFKIHDDLFFKDGGDYLGSISAVKDNGVFGTWYASNNVTYHFRPDGTVSLSNGSQYAYSVSGQNVILTLPAGSLLSLRISDDKKTMTSNDGTTLSVTKFDSFLGKWESAYYEVFNITFDGKNSASLVVNGNAAKSFTYVIDDAGVLSGTVGADELACRFNEDGLLEVEYLGVLRVLGREGSYIGTWIDPSIDYQFVLNGITAEGIGEGFDSHGFDFTYVYFEDEGGYKGLNFFYRTQAYGLGNDVVRTVNDKQMNLLELAMYTPGSGMMVDDYNMTYVDRFEGTYNADGVSLRFNGNGAYDINYTGSMTWDVRGFVEAEIGADSAKVRYFYDRTTSSATFTLNGTDYTVTAEGNDVRLTGGSVDKLLQKPDILSENDWYVGNIEKISFDGRGNVAGGGTAVFTENGVNTEYKYRENAGSVEIVDKETDSVVYNVNPETLELAAANGDKLGTLGVYDVITGREYRVKTGTGSLKLDCTEKLDKSGAAAAMLETEEVLLVYLSPEVLAMLDPTTEGLLYYMIFVDESTIALLEDLNNPDDVATVAYIPDEMFGVYASADETISLSLDGASNNTLFYASAYLTLFDANGEITNEFSYFYALNEDDNSYRIFYNELVDDGNGQSVTQETVVYTISLVEVDGATALTSASGKTIWLVAEA